jgi:hypothetical protein
MERIKFYPSAPRRKRAWLLALMTASMSLASGTALASPIEIAPCDDSPLSTPFARWGDLASYKLAPGGDFERSLSKWTLSDGADRVSDSEPWGVVGTVGGGALEVTAGASATSPPICVNAGSPSLRFFARSTDDLLAVLRVDVLYLDSALGVVSVPVGYEAAGGYWHPTLPLATASALPAATAGGQTSLRLRFTAVRGSWRVDDVFIDPYSRG